MPSSFRVLSSALLVGALLASPSAEARFGKHSDSSNDSKEESSRSESRSHDATPVNSDSGSSKPVHDASPVSDSRPPPPSSSPEPYYPPPAYEPNHEPYYEPHYEPYPTYVAPPMSDWEEKFVSRRHRNFTLGLEANVMRQGAGIGLHLGIEGDRVGGFLRTTGLSLQADDGSGETDEISVTEAHLSVTVLKGYAGRLRVEGGISIAKAPDVTFIGPSVGVSSEVYLLNNLALEGRMQLTPVPYRQLDAAGGLVWYFGGWRLFALRGGMRALVLNDAGLVDGVVHQDVLPGPYVSFGLAI